MEFKTTVFIGREAASEGWEKFQDTNKIDLKNNFERVGVEIVGERIEIEVGGDGCVILVRENKIAKLRNRVTGNVREGDKIWLCNQKAENEFDNGKRDSFEGAAVLIEIYIDEKENEKEIFVKERVFFQEKNNKNINMILGGVVFLLLVIGTVLGYQKRVDGEQKNKYFEIKNKVEEKLKEIEGVRSMNIETALELAKSAESLANNAGIAEKKYTKELMDLRNIITEVKKSLGGNNVEYEVAYDTFLIKEGDDIFTGMATKDGIAYLWSKNLGQINMIDPVLKSNEIIASDERIKNWLGIFNSGERWYGYDQNKIYEIKRNELIESEIKGVSSIGEMTGWNGLVYAVDNESQNIFKLSGGEGKVWLKEGTKLKEGVVGISIDSNIWLLGQSGKVYKYNRGAEEQFSMSSLTSLSSVKDLETSEQVNFLAYVADENTVVIYGKDGKILGKYNFSTTKINDIGIENKNKAVLVLTKNGKIYRIKIK